MNLCNYAWNFSCPYEACKKCKNSACKRGEVEDPVFEPYIFENEKNTFEYYLNDLQMDMVSACLKYVKKRAEKIYIYCSFEEGRVFSNFFYCINNKIVKKHELNNAVINSDLMYDVSSNRQSTILRAINNDIEKIYDLCDRYNRDMPTEIKLIYNVENSSLNVECNYDLVYSQIEGKSAYSVSVDWFNEISSIYSASNNAPKYQGLIMTDNDMKDFIEKIGRSELYEEIKTNNVDSNYLKGVMATLVTLGYDKKWVDTVFKDALEKKYLNN